MTTLNEDDVTIIAQKYGCCLEFAENGGRWHTCCECIMPQEGSACIHNICDFLHKEPSYDGVVATIHFSRLYKSAAPDPDGFAYELKNVFTVLHAHS